MKNIYISDARHRKLEEVSRESNQSITQILNELIDDYLFIRNNPDEVLKESEKIMNDFYIQINKTKEKQIYEQ